MTFAQQIIRIAPSMGAADAIVTFLNVAISLQVAGSTVIDTQETDKEFIEFHGFSKQELADGIEALRNELKRY